MTHEGENREMVILLKMVLTKRENMGKHSGTNRPIAIKKKAQWNLKLIKCFLISQRVQKYCATLYVIFYKLLRMSAYE